MLYIIEIQIAKMNLKRISLDDNGIEQRFLKTTIGWTKYKPLLYYLTDNENYRKIIKDRVDFGFDSIYFRYSEVIEELSWFKEREALKSGRDFDRKRWSDTKRQHFYGTLEQLTHAHERSDM